MSELATIPEIVETAQARLRPEIWDFSIGGGGEEKTVRRNRRSFDRWVFLPRLLHPVARRSLATTMLGLPMALPVFVAPVGSIVHFDPAGALACQRVTSRLGTLNWVSTFASPSLEDVRTGGDGASVFQLYWAGDRDWVRTIVRRAETAGYHAICLTADSPAYGVRDRDRRNRYVNRTPQENLAGRRPDPIARASTTWEDLAWLRELTRLPLVLKGVLTVADARQAVERGVDAVYVSNHGGNMLDHAPATLDVLPRIVDAVQGRAEVIVDGGFLRGTDVVKALALGARAVGIGRLTCWALAAGGEPMLARAFELIGEEIDVTMALIGAARPSQLTADFVEQTWPID